MEHVIILGAGGHALGIQEALLDLGYAVGRLGIVDVEAAEAETIFGVRRIGTDDDLPRLAAEGWKRGVVGVGSVEDTRLRRKLAGKLAAAGIRALTVTDPSARVSARARVGEGAYIAKGAIVQPDATIGAMAILNSGAIVEHNCSVGDFCHISSGAVLLGNVTVGDDTLIGAGSVVRQGVRVGRGCVVGAGSVVVADLPDRCVAYGNPCRIRRESERV